MSFAFRPAMRKDDQRQVARRQPRRQRDDALKRHPVRSLVIVSSPDRPIMLSGTARIIVGDRIGLAVLEIHQLPVPAVSAPVTRRTMRLKSSLGWPKPTELPWKALTTLFDVAIQRLIEHQRVEAIEHDRAQQQVGGLGVKTARPACRPAENTSLLPVSR